MVRSHGKFNVIGRLSSAPLSIHVLVICSAALFGNDAVCQSRRTALTNVQFVTHTADSAFQTLADGLMLEKNSSVLVKTGRNAEPVYNLLVQRFEHALLGRGISPLHSDGTNVTAEITVVPANLSLRYDRLRHNGLFGKKMVHRSFDFSLFLQIRDLPEGRMYASIDTTISAEGWFPEEEIVHIEKNRYGLRATRYPAASLSGWAEFGVYLLTFTALSYLLYSVRSQ